MSLHGSYGLKDQRHRILMARRLTVLSVLVQVVLIGIASGYFFVQVVEGTHYRGMADSNRLRRLAIESSRGLIYDRHQRLLVENIPNYQLYLDRSLSKDLEASLTFAAGILDQPLEELEATIERHRRTPSFQPVPLAERLTLGQVAQFGVQQLERPEFEIEVEHLRLYRHAHRAAHLLGYLGKVSKEDLDKHPRYRSRDLVGKKGIEQLYENSLRGRHGDRIVVVDSRGRQTEEFQRIPAIAGRNIRLTLDLDLQQEAARLLEDKAGAVVAMDPRNGDVLAMVSSPSFDPNIFARNLRPEQWQELTSHPKKPLQNRVIQNTYPPGSVFKIIVALAGLDRLKIDPKQTVYCPGYSTLYNNRYRCWKPSGHGRVNLQEALKYSCNVYFHQLGQKLGIDTIAAYARRFGLGQLTEIELTGEKRGLVPSTQWSLDRRGNAWYPGETISVATGQGPILVTPMQIAVMMSMLATGESRVVPRLVQSIESTSGDEVEWVRERHVGPGLELNQADLDLVREALGRVVNETDGTGHAAFLDDVRIAGKTGTAQVITQKTWTKNKDLAPEHRDHAWFASYAPLDDPQLVVVVFVEHGGGGSKAAAPIAQALYRKYFAQASPLSIRLADEPRNRATGDSNADFAG